MQQFSLIACLIVLSGILSAAMIAFDLRVRPQSMRIMNAVWILTGLWSSLPGLWAYYAFGRANPRKMNTMPDMNMGMHSMKGMRADLTHEMKGMDMPTHHMTEINSDSAHEMKGMDMGGMQMDGERPHWQSVVLSTLHCGAGCTLADLVGEWFFFFVPVAVGGSLVAGSWAIDYALALLFGIGFQYAAIRGMERSIPKGKAVARAAKADVLSLTAWQVGMYVWMAVVIFVFGDGEVPSRTSFWFWFMMMAAMYCGFLTALPVNVWLIRKGIKKGM